MVSNQNEQTPETASFIKKPKRQISLGVALSVGALVALVAFVLGGRTGNIFIWLNDGQNAHLSNALDVSSMQDVYRKLRDEFDGKLDEKKLIEGAKKGMVEAAGDPYTTYFTDEEAKQFFSDLDGKFSGIGAEIGKKDGALVIITTLDDSPARKSGVLSNDIVVKVNDQETTGWSIDKAVSVIRGEKGTTVKLTVLRNQQELKEISIVRDEIVNPSLKHEITADNIGIMRISRFAEDTAQLARRAADEFKQKSVRGVILDLRGNGGGYLTAAQDVASIWLPSGKVVVEERRGDSIIETLRVNGNPILAGVPTTVLIDGSSASASEIVAGALHDHKAAKLVGEKTFGKGSVQRIFDIVNNGQLKVTISKWFTPNGKNISKEGIAPDYKVEITETDARANKDPQKDKALELLKK